MTEDLNHAIRDAGLLPPERQNEIARFVLAAVAADRSSTSLNADQVREVEARLIDDEGGISLEQAKRACAGW